MSEHRAGPPGDGVAPGFDAPAGHAPAVHDDHHAPTIARNARYGFVLFAVYLALYAGFMALSAFAPERMGRPFLGGVNLAIVYGFGLIVAALVLAIVYMVLVRAGVRRGASGGGAEGGR